jgi:hypothetical protein
MGKQGHPFQKQGKNRQFPVANFQFRLIEDLLHQIVKETLMLDGWTITHDPYQMKEYDPHNGRLILVLKKSLPQSVEPTKLLLKPKVFWKPLSHTSFTVFWVNTSTTVQA